MNLSLWYRNKKEDVFFVKIGTNSSIMLKKIRFVAANLSYGDHNVGLFQRYDLNLMLGKECGLEEGFF
ncbi:MAG: hypothetical protein ACOYLE_03310 [Bacteroidales bacterium]